VISRMASGSPQINFHADPVSKAIEVTAATIDQLVSAYVEVLLRAAEPCSRSPASLERNCFSISE
jgi:hypothetical protein